MDVRGSRVLQCGLGCRQRFLSEGVRQCAILIDCRVSDIDEAACFWADALGRPIDPDHPGTRGNYRMLETPPDEPIVQIQKVEHESRVHIDIETDDIPAEVAR